MFFHASTPITITYRLSCLLVMGVVFYSTYGLANHWASLQNHVPEIFWDWERHLPFWSWSIVPYWSLNVFYAAAFLVCQNKSQIQRLLQQLLLAQAIAVVCFVAFPLTFTWTKPPTDGWMGQLFTALAGFDQPYNQAPSLHIILTVIIGRFYWYRLPACFRPMWLLWMVLIGISVLTTYQHHFIDIPTGMFVGLLILWLLPCQHNLPVKMTFFRHTPIAISNTTPKHRQWAMTFLGAALVSGMLAMCLQDAYWWLLWLSLAWAWRGLMYVSNQTSWWQKQANGQHAFAVWLFAWPLRFFYRMNMAFWLRQKPLSHALDKRLHLGSILAIPDYQAVLDVCAEYPVSQTPRHYVTVPMLDMVAADAKTLAYAADQLHNLLKQNQIVLVCCGLGYSRSAAVVATYYLRYGQTSSLQDALNKLTQSGRHIVLSEQTQEHIQKAAHA